MCLGEPYAPQLAAPRAISPLWLLLLLIPGVPPL